MQPTSLLFPVILVLYEMTTYLSNDMYLPALPQMMIDLGLSAKVAQLTLTSWFVGSAITPLIMGIISDRVGRRPVLLIGGVIYVIATILCALPFNATILLFARLIEGAMTVSMIVPGYACIHESYEKKEVIKILALMGSISVLAPALGPLLGGMVLMWMNWRGIFWIIALIASLLIIWLSRIMPETLRLEHRHPVHFQTLVKHYKNILTNSRYLLLMLVLGFIFASFISWITSGPLLVMETFHYSAMGFGVIQAIVFGAYILGNAVIKQLIDRLSARSLIRLGITIAGVGALALLGAVYGNPDSLMLFLMAMIIFSFGSGVCFAPLNRVIIESSKEPMGVRVGMFTVFLQGFAVLGSGLASLCFTGTPASLAYLIAGGVVFAFILLTKYLFLNTH